MSRLEGRKGLTLALLGVGYGALGATGGAYAQNAEGTQSQTAGDNSSRAVLQEVTVTATRRVQTVQDVPYNVSSVGSEALQQAGITTAQGLAQLVPGLETIDTGPDTRGGNNQFSMRGLRTDAPGNETPGLRSGSVAPVSTYLGETPIFFPLALKDLDRVEVLKGPQGTLYGSGALAGTIRFMPKRPDFDKTEGSVDVVGGGTQHSGKANGSIDGVFNLPLASNLALRVAAGYERFGGFINEVDLIQRSVPGNPLSAPVLRVPSDPRSGYALAPIAHDTNNAERWYVRPVVRWKPTETIDAELSYMHQRVSTRDQQLDNRSYPGGTYSFDSVSGDPNAVNHYRPGGPYQNTADVLAPSASQLDLGSLVVTADLGFASLTSSSSVYRVSSWDHNDYVDSTQIFNPDGSLQLNYYDFWNNYPRANLWSFDTQKDQSFIQEVRLVSTWHKAIDYIVGAYYQAQRFNFSSGNSEPGYTDYVTAINGVGLPRPSADVQYLYQGDNGFHFRDRAAFGELTWHVTSQWQVTGGIRLFRQDFRNFAKALDWFNGGDAVVDLDVDNSNRVGSHIFKFNTSYDFTRDLKLYATYSEGFRRGGANAIPTAGGFASLPQYLNYTPDKSKNHEIGLKGRLLDGALRYTVDAFLIKLDNFQFNSYTGSSFPVVINGGEARSKGAELETQYQLTRQMVVGFSYAYTNAKVQNGFSVFDYGPAALLSPGTPQLIPVAVVAGGARLPATPQNSANASINYMVPLNAATVLLHLDAAYRDSAPAYIDPTSSRYWVIPASLVSNTRVTYDSGQNWSVDAFINNLTNETVYSGSAGTGQTVPNLFQERYVGRPRTYGLGLHYKW